jgi:hypothetical protein
MRYAIVLVIVKTGQWDRRINYFIVIDTFDITGDFCRVDSRKDFLIVHLGGVHSIDRRPDVVPRPDSNA